jgi:O-antigen/teichoic acid export membrane protein
LKTIHINQTNNTIQAFWVALGSLTSMGLALVSAAILSRYFDKSDYGTFKQIGYVYSTLLIIFTAGLPQVFAYFLPRYSLEEGKNIVQKINKTLFIAGFAFSIFLYLFSGIIANLLNNPDLSLALKVFSPIPMFMLPTLGMDGIFSTYKKTIFIAIYGTLSRLLMLLFIIVPVIVFKGDYLSAVYGWLVASILTFGVAIYFKRIPFKGVKSVITSLNNKEIFAYSLPIVLASMWGVATKASDQFYISRFFGREVFAEFSNGFIDLPFVSMVTASASVVIMPLFSKLLTNIEGKEEVIKVWNNTISKSAIIIYPILVFCIFNATNIVEILYSSKYLNSAIYFSIYMGLNFFNIIIFAPLMFSLGETRFYARMHMYIALISWIGMYVVVLMFNSPIAVAVLSTCFGILRVIIALRFIAKKLSVRVHSLFPVINALKIMLHCSIIGIIILSFNYLFLNEINAIYLLFINLSIFICFTLLTSSFFKINYFSVYQPLINKLKKNVS